MIDLAIKNGFVYTPSGFVRAGVAIEGEKIVAVAKEAHIPKAEKIVDAAGKFVIPGIIDVHVHMREPGFTEKEDYTTGTKAAAAGGITFVCPQPNLVPVPNTVENYMMQIELGEKKAVVDFNPIASPLLYEKGQVPELAKAGTGWFKIFQRKAAYPYDTAAGTSNTAHIYKAFKAVAPTGLYVAVHPCNIDILNETVSDLEKANLKGDYVAYWSKTYSNEELTSAALQLGYLAEKAGCKYYALHCYLSDYIDVIRRMKASGQNVVASAEALGLFPMTKEEAGEFYGPFQSFEKENQEATWRGLLDGTIDFLGTDHAPTTKESVMEALSIREPEKRGGGNPMLEVYLPLMLTAVNKGMLGDVNQGLERMVKLCAEKAARAFSFYPRKGVIQVGSDADITIVDLDREDTITTEKYARYTKAHWTPYVGRKVKGVPTHTIVRGSIVMEEGEILVNPGYGKFIKPVR